MPFYKRFLSSRFDFDSSGMGLLAIALAAALWAIAAVVARRLFDAGVTPFELGMARAIVTVIGLGVITQINRKRHHWMDWRIVALGLSLALVTACYYVAINRLSVAIALVIQYTGPAIVVLIDAVRTRSLPTAGVIKAVMAALLGVSLIAGVFSGGLRLDAVGLLAASFSAVFFASYTLLSESVVNVYGPLGVMFRGFLISSLFWVMLQLSQGFPQAVFAAANLSGILFVGVGGTLIPFCLMCWGIQRVNAQRAAIAATLEPVIGAVLAWLWLGQDLTATQIFGGALVLGAVLLLQKETGRVKHEG